MTSTPAIPSASAELARLEDALRGRERVLTAFSGGVDSTVVAAAARRVLGKDAAPAVVGDSASLPRQELAEVHELAERLDLKLIVVHPDEQNDPGYQANAGDRCFFCKTHLYTEMHAKAKELGIPFIANGTNTDDLGDHRPGLVAAENAGVISPLLDAGLDKAAVRAIAEELGLPNADKPAMACLASRLPYGTEVTPERLAQVERAERALCELGFTGFRVRHHEDVARLEVPMDQFAELMAGDMRERAVAAIKNAGYTYVALDLEGFRSGSGNIALTIEGAQHP